MPSKANKVHPAEGGGMRRRHDGPIGVPINCVARVLQREKKGYGGGQDLRFTANKVVVNESGDFDFDFVYGPDSSAGDLITRNIRPLVKAAVEGVNVAVLLLGSVHSDKTSLGEQLIPMICQDLCATLQKSVGKKKGSGNPFSLKMRAYEIYDEVIQDLFNAEQRDLRIINAADEGHVVAHCSTKGPYHSVDDLLDTVADSFKSRNDATSQFGPASNFTSTVWQIDISQHTKAGSNGPSQSTHSKIVFVEVAATDRLSEERTAVRAREGPTLSKSLFTLQSASDAFVRQEHDYAVLSESKLTQLLEDSLVGNSITLCVASLRQGEGDVSAATAQLGQMLRHGQTFPISNNDRVRGLLRHYRLQINILRDELQVALHNGGAGGKGSNNSDEDVQELNIKLSELEGRIVRDNLDKLRMKEDKEKIYQKLVEFREKYNTLCEQKSHIQAESIKSEEEKLRVSKALLDLRIENNKLVERCEADKFELVTKLLNCENEVLQYEMKEEGREKNEAALKSELEKARSSSNELKEDFAQLKSNYVRVEEQFKAELSKNEELGMELLTLVNQKNALASEADELRKEHTKLLKDFKSLDAKHIALMGEKAELDDALKNERKTRDELNSEKMRVQLELQRTMVEFETQRLDIEKNANDINRERESELVQVKSKLEAESKRNEATQEALRTELRECRAAIKISTRKIQELEEELSEKNEEIVVVKSENNSMTDKLSVLTEDYREKILELMNATYGDGTKDEEDGRDPEDLERENLQKTLAQSFKDREAEMGKKMRDLQSTNLKIVQKNRLLYQRYRACRNRLEDLDVDVNQTEALSPKSPQINAIGGPAGDASALVVGSSQVEDQLRKQISSLEERVSKANADLKDVQEKNISLVSNIKRLNRENEVRISDLQSEIKILERQKANLEEENHAMAQRAGTASAGVDSEASKQMQAVQESLLRKIEDLQKATAQQITSTPMQGVVSDEATRARLAELERTNKELQAEVQSYRQQLEEAKRANPFPSARSTGASKEELERLKKENQKLKELYARKASAAVPQPPPDGGSTNIADLLTRCTVAETELKNYKNYIKVSLAAKENQIKKLKKERDHWKAKAGG